MKIKILTYFLVVFLLCCCEVSKTLTYRHQFTPINEIRKSEIVKSNNVDVYFINEKLDFEYKKIGLAEINLKDLPKDHAISFLQDLAWQQGGNAVIFSELELEKIKKQQKTVNNKRNRKRDYYYNSRSKIKGLVVKKDTINSVSIKSKSVIDTNFRNIVKADIATLKKRYQNRINSQFAAIVPLVVIGAIICLIFFINLNNE